MLSVRRADLAEPREAAALVEIIDTYAREPGGQGAPISDHARAHLVAGLAARPHTFVLMAFDGDEPVGAAVCVETFSTFLGRPALNLHDLAVLPSHRGRGAGGLLLAEMEREARARGCCKLSLEVNDTNVGAQRLYERFGFGPWDRHTYFVTKRID